MMRVVHFDFPAEKPERAAAFYGNVFGWKIAKWEGPQEYWLVTTGDGTAPGIDGGIMRRESPDEGVTVTVDVPSVDEYAARIQQEGGQIVVPKMVIPGVGYIAYFRDPEGNISGIMEEDHTAH